MKVPLLDLHPQMQRLRPLVLEALIRVLDSTGYILGPEVIALEERIASYCQTPYAVGLSSGTDALLVALMSLDISPGDRVVTTPYSFFATMGVVLRLGAEPVFVDIDPLSFNIDPAKAAEALELERKQGGRIKAILPVHLYGQCADMQPLLELSASYHIPLIEDAAQAIGAEYPFVQPGGALQWRRAGSMGLCGCFSFFPSKNLGGIGDGGMLTTQDQAFAELVRCNRNHGAEPRYFHSRVGGNFRLDPIQAAVLAVKLDFLDEWQRGRQKNAALYRQFFEAADLNNNPVRLPAAIYAPHDVEQQRFHHVYNQFVIQTPDRDRLRQFLQEQGVTTEIYYPLCLHQQACLRNKSYGGQSFPQAEKAAATSLALPIYPELSSAQIEYVVAMIQQFYAKR